jgi:23S rRNA (uracil747-C5)-methyltransferase
VAAALYREAAAWAATTGARSAWDLYSGVGGFALHLAGALDADAAVTGVELSPEAVEGARASARERGLDHVSFVAGDAAAYAPSREAAPELVVVNPPRRGLGEGLSRWVESSGARWLLYSSCNAVTLAADLERMPSLEVTRARMFAMFPQTRHHEVLVLARRR